MGLLYHILPYEKNKISSFTQAITQKSFHCPRAKQARHLHHFCQSLRGQTFLDLSHNQFYCLISPFKNQKIFVFFHFLNFISFSSLSSRRDKYDSTPSQMMPLLHIIWDFAWGWWMTELAENHIADMKMLRTFSKNIDKREFQIPIQSHIWIGFSWLYSYIQLITNQPIKNIKSTMG